MSYVFTSSQGRRAVTRSGTAGFTLVEMLVAVVVMSLLVGLLLQIFIATFAATRLSHQKIEADKQARQVLDAVGNDYLGLITQNGTPMLIGSSQDSATLAVNAQLCFLTQSRGPNANTRCMAVSYLLNGGNLERLSQPVLWSSTTAPVQNVLAAASSTTVSEVATGILRFVAVVSMSDGSVVPLTPLPATMPVWMSASFQGQLVSPFLSLNLTDTTLPRARTITIAVAALDGVNYHLLSAANLSTVATALPASTVGTGTPPRCATPVELWESAIASGQLASLPRPALAALQIVQTTYPLPQ